MSALELKRLRKQFGELVAVDDIDLSVEEGEIRGLIGPNGSGKTTLFNLTTGFIKPTQGQVIWRGEDITGKPPHLIAKKGIARTFQSTSLLTRLTVLENVTLACHLRVGQSLFSQFLRNRSARGREEAVRQEAEKLLANMGIASLKNEVAGDLPHGHQRTLGIAIALATRPLLLLLDEPAAGMNPVETGELMQRIRVVRDTGITIVLVEHAMKAVMNTCEKITVMNFGKKIAEGCPNEVTKDKDVIEAYLGKE